MENRDRDKVSRNTTPTSAGNVNRSTSSEMGRNKSDSNADFGQNIGRSENLGNEPSRKSGSDSSGWQGNSRSSNEDIESGSNSSTSLDRDIDEQSSSLGQERGSSGSKSSKY